MAISVGLDTQKQIRIQDLDTGEYIGNIYAPNITSFTKLIRRFYPNDQGLVPDKSYVGVGYTNKSAKEQWIVRMHLNNGMYEDIPLTGAEDMPSGWTNDETGYYQAVQDITVHANT